VLCGEGGGDSYLASDAECMHRTHREMMGSQQACGYGRVNPDPFDIIPISDTVFTQIPCHPSRNVSIHLTMPSVTVEGEDEDGDDNSSLGLVPADTAIDGTTSCSVSYLLPSEPSYFYKLYLALAIASYK
jgi:hypothetical protein